MVKNGVFYEKRIARDKSNRVEKVIKIIHLMTGYIRKILLYNMSYLAEP